MCYLRIWHHPLVGPTSLVLGGCFLLRCVNVLDGINVPVWHQGILLPSEHDANVGGMVLGGVEVCVVTWRETRWDY